MNRVFRALEHNFKIPFISLCILSYKSKESLWSEHSKLKSGSALGMRSRAQQIQSLVTSKNSECPLLAGKNPTLHYHKEIGTHSQN